MNLRILILSMVVFVASCTTVYQTGQTPDDVYYSPASARSNQEGYVETNPKESYRSYNNDYYEDEMEDRWLRMRIRNRYRWNMFDDYDFYGPGYGMGFYGTSMYGSSMYWGNGFYGGGHYGSFGSGFYGGYGSGFYSGYGMGYYGLGMGYNSYWNNSYAWNSVYNPYSGHAYYGGYKEPVASFSKMRNVNPNSYRTSYNNTNARSTIVPSSANSGRYTTPTRSSYNNTNSSNTSLGTSLRKAFSNGGSSNSNTSSSNGGYSPSYDRPTRSYTPSSSSGSSSSSNSGGGSSSSSSSGSSSGGSVSRPGRGN